MKNLETIKQKVKIQDRERILRNEVLSLAQVADKLLRRASRENVPDERVLWLIDYLLSFEAFAELESYWFYFYDPKNLNTWNEILDHVYRRSITPKHFLN